MSIQRIYVVTSHNKNVVRTTILTSQSIKRVGLRNTTGYIESSEDIARVLENNKFLS